MARNTTADEDQGFAEALAQECDLNVDLSKVFEYINANFDPEDVFDEDRLREWGFKQAPEDIFDFPILEDWAFGNNFIAGA